MEPRATKKQPCLFHHKLGRKPQGSTFKPGGGLSGLEGGRFIALSGGQERLLKNSPLENVMRK